MWRIVLKNVYDGIIGLAIGDALGVPVEFRSRQEIAKNPVVSMREYGTHKQPIGTWFDDTSLTLALMDSIVENNEINYTDIMDRFSNWLMYNDYTATREVFDVGNSNSRAIMNYGRGMNPIECGGTSEYENGNGSLMRILPLAFYFTKLPDTNMEYRMEIIMSKYDKLSVFVSLILRHKPDAAGIQLDEHGWANVDELIEGINNTGRKIDKEILYEIVKTDNKKRYSFNENKTLIRANQGHSIPVDVELQEQQPPQFLFHGTADRFLDSIMTEGLKSMSRLYVHLSKDKETAVKVGKRHGNPIVLKIRAKEMFDDGIKFYLSQNGVWLTKNVDNKYIDVMTR